MCTSPNLLCKYSKVDRTLFGVECIFDCSEADTHLDGKINLLKKNGFDFLCYPAGGTKRYLWNTSSIELPPAIFLPDAQMDKSLWRTSVCLLISKWIDLDSENPRLTQFSAKSLIEELDHASYLSAEFVAIELKHISSPNLAASLRNWTSINTFDFRFWIILPASISYLSKERSEDSAGDNVSVLDVWRNFHSSAFSRKDFFDVGLRIHEDSDEEFIDDLFLNQWRGEPFTSIWLDSSLFLVEGPLENNDLSLTSFHRRLLTHLSDVIEFVLLKTKNDTHETLHFLHSQVDHVRKFVDEMVCQIPIPKDAFDTLQIPLQPLSENLRVDIYHTLELDKVKYDKYGEAIFAALSEIFARKVCEKQLNLVTVFVLGAGRGPLVEILLKLWASLVGKLAITWKMDKTTVDSLIQIWAVEKNYGAVQTLHYYNSTRWSSKVNVLHCDMRDLGRNLLNGQFSRADLVISELLGSFGDNELCPECLVGAEKIFHENTISIPQSYCSYLSPIHSVVLRRQLLNYKEESEKFELRRIGRNINKGFVATDCLYVAFMRRACLLGDPVPCFSFSHPGYKASESNTCINQKLYFLLMQGSCTVDGFAGFFEAKLYKNIKLSTVPGRETPGMFSWASAFLPLRNTITLSARMTTLVQLEIERHYDNYGVWYSWVFRHEIIQEDEAKNFTAQRQLSEISNDSLKTHGNVLVGEYQNINGHTQYMRL